MSVGIVRPELYARAVEFGMATEPISDREADEILAAYVNPKPVNNPVFDSQLADPLNTTGQRKQTPERKTRDELIAQGIAAGRIIDMRRKV